MFMQSLVRFAGREILRSIYILCPWICEAVSVVRLIECDEGSLDDLLGGHCVVQQASLFLVRDVAVLEEGVPHARLYDSFFVDCSERGFGHLVYFFNCAFGLLWGAQEPENGHHERLREESG